jgi:hypothetical protein
VSARFGARHTLRWALHNLSEFDRRHLRGAGKWLFGQRPMVTRRPVRRIVGILNLALWVSLWLVAGSGPRHAALVAAVTRPAALGVALTALIFMGAVAGWRLAKSRRPRRKEQP